MTLPSTDYEPSIALTGAKVMQFLRISLHVLFALLLIVGAINALVENWQQPLILTLILMLVALLGTLYMAGTVYENRRASRSTSPRVQWLSTLWLALITIFWVVLMTFSSSFTWAVFPLLFLYLYLLPFMWGLMAVLVLTSFAIFYPVATSTVALTLGSFIGPALGALIAVIIFLTYKGLYEDAVHNAHIVQQLRATRAELAHSQHEAGRLEERERLAREIHDTLAQGLSSIVLMSRAGQATLTSHKYEATVEALRTIETSASDNLAEARRFIKDLSSPNLDMNLVARLQKLVDDTNAQSQAQGSQLQCSFSCEGQLAKIPEHIAQELLRIGQGALSNVVAHAQATQAVLTLSRWEGHITLDIFDNGIGFNPNQVTASQDGKRYGLISMQTRIKQLDGTFNITQVEPHGTIVTVEIPLESA